MHALIGKETTWGTPVATAKDVGLVQNVTFNPDLNYTQAHALGSTIPQDISSGRADMKGSIDLIFQHGRLLEYLTGGTVTHGATSTPDIQHTYALAETLPSFTLGRSFDSTADIMEVWSGCKITSATLALALNGYLKMRADIAFKDYSPASTTADTGVISTLKPMKDFMGTVSFGAASTEAVLAVVQSCEVTFNNVATGEGKLYGLESKLPAILDVTGRTYDLKFGLAFQSVIEMNRFLGVSTGVLDTGAEIAASSLILDINNAVTAASGRRGFYLNLTNAYLNRVSLPTAIGGWIIADFEGMATTLNSMYTWDNITSVNW